MTLRLTLEFGWGDARNGIPRKNFIAVDRVIDTTKNRRNTRLPRLVHRRSSRKTPPLTKMGRKTPILLICTRKTFSFSPFRSRIARAQLPRYRFSVTPPNAVTPKGPEQLWQPTKPTTSGPQEPAPLTLTWQVSLRVGPGGSAGNNFG